MSTGLSVSGSKQVRQKKASDSWTPDGSGEGSCRLYTWTTTETPSKVLKQRLGVRRSISKE